MTNKLLLLPLAMGLVHGAATDHLVSYWSLETNTNDSATAGSAADNGSWIGTTRYSAGKFGKAIQTDGNSYVNVPSSADLTGSSNTISVSSWFRISSFDTLQQTLIAKGVASNWRLNRNGNTNGMAWSGGAAQLAGGSVNDGAWHHILGVSEAGNSTRFYLDGALIATGAAPAISDSGSAMFIGNNPGDLTKGWNGFIDDVGIFDAALNDFEAAAIHSLGRDANFNYDLSQVNELLKLGRCPAGTKLTIIETEWESVASDPANGRAFFQLSSTGSGISEVGGPKIFLFEVDHPTIPANEPITFTWQVDPASEQVLFDVSSTVIDVTADTVAGSGSLTFNPGPSANQTYFFGAAIGGKFTIREQLVTVTDQPIIDQFTANPGSVEPGGTVTFSWATFNSTSVTLNGQSVAANGSATRTPGSSQTFTLAASNSLGTTDSSILVPVVPSGEPLITEFLASNEGSLLDEDGDSPDWIQISNPSSSPAIISGEHFLTDDPTDLQKWAIPSQTLLPGDSVFYFASGKSSTATPHVNFSLSSGGEYLALVKVSGGITTILSEFNEFPRQFRDLSYGLGSDFETLSYYETPSPNGPNTGTAFEDYVRDTSFSIKRGFYTTAQSVEITSTTLGTQIYYTTNGSEPSVTNGTLYTGPISIGSTTTLRAVGTKANQIPTNVDTNTYIFTADVVNQPVNPPGWPTNSVNGQVLDYEMDPGSIVSSSTQGVIDALESIPSFSIVTDQANLTDPTTGIYVRPQNRGRSWERPASLELIFPPGYVSPDGLTEGFQENFGVRVRGGFSRLTSNPKHAFRMFFRDEYGKSSLNYPLFGSEGTDEFAGFDLRTAQNYSWSFKNFGSLNSNTDNSSKNTFLREVFARDTQREMGEQYTRSRYCHLYLNGIYWGLFMTQERSEADFGASYFGGKDDDYDTIKSTGASGDYDAEATDGDTLDWMTGYNLAIATSTEAETNNTSYFQIQGLDSSGNPDPSVPTFIDVENLINYMMVVFYNGSFDAPLSTFIGASNNWFAVRNRETDDRGWSFFAHDMEHSLGSFFTDRQDRTGPFQFGNETTFAESNPQYIHQYLAQNLEYRLKFADITHDAFFNGGLYTNQAVLARFAEREVTVEKVIDAEAARWGDSKRPSNPLDRTDWALAVDQLKGWTTDRNLEVLAQLKIDDLYPATDAPVFSQHGGQISPGFMLTMNNPNGSGTIYYTTDGTDPRNTGGTVSSSAASGAVVTLSGSTVIQSRVRAGSGEWSALTSASFATAAPPVVGSLVITEINYHPANPTAAESAAGFTSDGDFEFIEIANVSNASVDLTGATLSDEITFDFTSLVDPDDRILAAGSRILIVRDTGGFAARYPGVPAFGPYAGGLSNNNGTVELRGSNGSLLYSVSYDDNNGWPEAADGAGYSLVLRDASMPNDPASWRLSVALNGNPGTSDSQPFTGGDLLAAVLRDGAGAPVEPSASIESFDDGSGAQDYLHLNLQRYLPVDNAVIEIQHASALQGWVSTDIQLASSIPAGDGSVIESYRLNLPVSTESKHFMRVVITQTP